jgi:pyruvate-formate lyase-activating enzyme
MYKAVCTLTAEQAQKKEGNCVKTPKLLYANAAGEVMDHPRYLAPGRTGDYLTDVEPHEWIPLPEGATLTWLPGTRAIGIRPEDGQLEALPASCYAVGALLPQGYTRLFLPGYSKRAKEEETLPLFGYTAVGWHKDAFVVAAHQTDASDEWNPEAVSEADVEAAVQRVLQTFPENRLFAHLSHCALVYGCMTARNTFLGRQEGAIPASNVCNAACVGCISEQPEGAPFPAPQTRLTFRPTVEEMVEVMHAHIQQNPRGVVSFGQGCEGEPSTRFLDIAKSIRALRERTSDGYVNINTNAGFTRGIQRIVDAGLNLMRVSTISAIPEHYDAYYRPRQYKVSDVEASLAYAADHGVYTSINYLVFPGVSDREEEVEAMAAFLRRAKVKLVQMRNLNIDPEYYLRIVPQRKGDILGMVDMMDVLKSECTGLEIGSYTHVPPVQHNGVQTQHAH